MYGARDSSAQQTEQGGQPGPKKLNTPFKMGNDTVQYVVFVFPNNNTVGSNEFKVALSNYHNKYYSVKSLQISNSFIGIENQFVMVRQFDNKGMAKGYLEGILDDGEALQDIDMSYVNPLIITPENMLLLVQTRDLAGYEDFYNNNYNQ